ncbi:MAG TPA: hypothetical protein VGN23_02805 [Verrucomicrobiae bacterium]|jgi:hypothetical protein
MKKQFTKWTFITLCAAAVLAVPALSRAQDDTNSAAVSAPAKHKKHNSLPFRGNLDGVDTNAMTVTVGSMTFQVTSKTKITKDGQPAVLGDGVVGQPVSGSYSKTEDATNAVSIHFGAKAKKSVDSSDSTTSGGGNTGNQ